jgi:hypothetical protein
MEQSVYFLTFLLISTSFIKYTRVMPIENSMGTLFQKLYFRLIPSFLSYSFPIPFIYSFYRHSSPTSFLWLLYVKAIPSHFTSFPSPHSYLYLLPLAFAYLFPIPFICPPYCHSSHFALLSLFYVELSTSPRYFFSFIRFVRITPFAFSPVSFRFPSCRHFSPLSFLHLFCFQTG